MFQKIICLFKGHVNAGCDTAFTRHYVRVPAGRGPFCRDPERYEYVGRLYRCSRCSELLLKRGAWMWEIIDLIETTLKDLPTGMLSDAFDHQNYEWVNRLYGI